MDSKSNIKILNEGIKKGGINPKPSTSRPVEPPKAQAPKITTKEKK